MPPDTPGPTVMTFDEPEELLPEVLPDELPPDVLPDATAPVLTLPSIKVPFNMDWSPSAVWRDAL